MEYRDVYYDELCVNKFLVPRNNTCSEVLLESLTHSSVCHDQEKATLS